MLKRGKTVEEIVEFFRTYQMEGGLSFEPRVYRQSRSSSRQSSVEPEETELADKISFKVKTRDNGNTNETRSNENNSQNKNSADDLKRSSEPKDNTELHTNASCKINEDGDMQDTKELQETNDVDVVKEKGWGNATEKMEKILSNLDNMVRNVETDNRIVEKLSKISERKGHEPDQEVSTNINFCENMTDNSPTRNVFDLVDADFIKRMIPFMHPKSRNHTFKYFLDKVDEVVEAVGEDKILNSEILDLMQYR